VKSVLAGRFLMLNLQQWATLRQ